jgi:diphosphomevalonate decarboxylase
VNIALAKYWGKSNEELHIPVTDSFSVALNLHTATTVRQALAFDEVTLNSSPLPSDSAFYTRCVQFLDLFRPSPRFAFSITTTNNVPTAAGLASSASGFAALTLALNAFFGWNLERQHLSCLARLGSGSACRSVYSGFVRWQKGSFPDGRDSYAIPFDDWWSDLGLAILTLSSKEKPISSREAMRLSVQTSPVYALWPAQVRNDMVAITTAIHERNFQAFGQAVEKNALMMHATMLTSTPPVCYWLEETVASMNVIFQARKRGVEVYFTMDAGPNIKLLFLKHDAQSVLELFPKARLVDLLP